MFGSNIWIVLLLNKIQHEIGNVVEFIKNHKYAAKFIECFRSKPLQLILYNDDDNDKSNTPKRFLKNILVF